MAPKGMYYKNGKYEWEKPIWPLFLLAVFLIVLTLILWWR